MAARDIFGQLHAGLSRREFIFQKTIIMRKLLSILLFSILLCLVPLFFVDTISGLKSKLLCWQQMSFKICLQSRNMCSLKSSRCPYPTHNVALIDSLRRFRVKAGIEKIFKIALRRKWKLKRLFLGNDNIVFAEKCRK